jgi:hypothetical protein
MAWSSRHGDLRHRAPRQNDNKWFQSQNKVDNRFFGTLLDIYIYFVVFAFKPKSRFHALKSQYMESFSVCPKPKSKFQILFVHSHGIFGNS